MKQALDRLFGESLFGAWPDSYGATAIVHSPRRGRVVRRLGLILLLGLIATSGIWLYRRAAQPQADQERRRLAGQAAALLAEGALDRLAEVLGRLLPPGKPLTAEDPDLDVIVSAEAALYRYQDAAPERLARIEPFLSEDARQPARLLARLTVASRPERISAHGILIALPAGHAQGSEYHALMATIHEERGDVQAARASWERSLAAGPQWLPHRYLQCGFEARQHNAQAVARMAEHMARVAPDSTWTRLVQQHFASSPTTGVAPAAPPVARYFAELVPIFQGLATHDLAAARQTLGRALAAINDQAAFVIDAFRGLRDAKADALAMELTSYEVWPRGNPWARGVLSELQASLADNSRSATPPSARTKARSGSHRKVVKAGGKKKVVKNAKGKAKKPGKAKPRRGRK